MERIELLLGQILEELRTHHAWARDQEIKLDERDEIDRKRKAELDQVVLESMELQKQALATVQASPLISMPNMPKPPKPPEGKAS